MPKLVSVRLTWATLVQVKLAFAQDANETSASSVEPLALPFTSATGCFECRSHSFHRRLDVLNLAADLPPDRASDRWKPQHPRAYA